MCLVWGGGHPKLQEGILRMAGGRTGTCMCVCVCVKEKGAGGGGGGVGVMSGR